MQILHICSDFWGTSLYNTFQQELLRQGADSVFTVPISWDTTPPQHDNSIIPLHCFSKWMRLCFSLKQKHLLKAHEQVLGTFFPNLIHSHFLFTNGSVALALKKKYNIPYITAVRNTDVNVFFKYMPHLKKLGNLIMSEAAKVIFLSPAYLESTIEKYVYNSLKEKIRQKSEVLPNGISNFWHDNTPPPRGNRVLRRFLTVAEITPNKNHLTTCKAIQKYSELTGLSVKYTIIGKNYSARLLRKLESFPFVTYIPPLPREALLTHYRENDIFIMPSIHETFGLVYPEALSQGLPVIYSKGQGFDGYFKDNFIGKAVPCMDKDAIAEAIFDIQENYVQISRNCLNEAYIFRWQTIAQKYIHIYTHLKHGGF